MTPTTEPGRLDRPSRELDLCLRDLADIEDCCRFLIKHLPDLEASALKRRTGDVVNVATSREEWYLDEEGDARARRLWLGGDAGRDGTQETDPKWVEGDKAEPPPQYWNPMHKRVHSVQVEAVRLKMALANYFFAKSHVMPGGSREVLTHDEHSHVHETAKERHERGEYTPVLLDPEQPKWRSR